MAGVILKVRVLPHGEGLPLPNYASLGAAGLDLYAAIDSELTLEPWATETIPTGIAIALPNGHEAQVRPRSGLARDYHLGIINSPGTIDSDYRGEIQVILTNFSDQPYTLRRGDRVGQLVVARYETVEWEPVAELPPTSRGSGGFGHSGK